MMKRTKPISVLRSGWMALAVIVLVAAFVSADWYYYSQTRRNLDEEFGKRLAAIAELSSGDIARHVPSPERSSFDDSLIVAKLRSELDGIRARHSLFNIVVLGEDYVTLLSLERGLYPEETEYPHWKMDYAALAEAFRGRASGTALYEGSGTFLKAGYAPLPPESREPRFVVGVEASARFLEGIERLRLILVAVTGVSIAGVVLFTVFALKATASLIRTRESLMHAESLATMGQMAAGVAHEIRNPLFIIRSAAEKLRARHPESAADIDNYLVDEVDRLNGTLTDYLLFARDEPTRRETIDLVATLGRSVRNLRGAISGSPIVLETMFGLAAAPFFGEEKRMQQTFLNLLLNARQAIRGNGAITVSLAAEGGRYVVRIGDSGEGIPPRDLDRIFEPFYTTKPQGSGLGLPIAKKVIEAHGGSIAIESVPGAGTVVTILLPAPREGTESTQAPGEDPGSGTNGA